eukprot:269096-Amphidinium_carterae.5
MEPNWQKKGQGMGQKKCKHVCDPDPATLLAPALEPHKKVAKLMAYITPKKSVWHELSEHICGDSTSDTLFLCVSHEDWQTLSVPELKIDYKSHRGRQANIFSKKKSAVIRGVWKPLPIDDIKRSAAAQHAFDWLCAKNSTYARYIKLHKERYAKHNSDIDQHWRGIKTAQLLLNSPGIQVAARPWLYPLASFADSDISTRLVQLGHLKSSNKPSLQASWMRKLTSRCLEYGKDYPLNCLFYDMAMASTISAVVSIAAQQKVAPDQIASDMDMFQAYWHQQVRKMEDVCRQEMDAGRPVEQSLPSTFFTLAPAEWKYVLHEGMFQEETLTEPSSSGSLPCTCTTPWKRCWKPTCSRTARIYMILGFKPFANGQYASNSSPEVLYICAPCSRRISSRT